MMRAARTTAARRRGASMTLYPTAQVGRRWMAGAVLRRMYDGTRPRSSRRATPGARAAAACAEARAGRGPRRAARRCRPPCAPDAARLDSRTAWWRRNLRRRSRAVSARPCSVAAMDAPRALLIDLDGVLYVEDEPVAGAREAVAELRARGLALRFVTNTTSRPRGAILERLHRLGFEVAADELSTPAALAVAHCLDAERRRAMLLVRDDVKEDFDELEEASEGVEAVVVGDLGEAFGYAVLNRAFGHVMDGAELIALQKNRYWLRPEGLALDVGPFVAALEYATRREAFVVGKPSKDFFATI